jgi:hypothetical protein
MTSIFMFQFDGFNERIRVRHPKFGTKTHIHINLYKILFSNQHLQTQRWCKILEYISQIQRRQKSVLLINLLENKKTAIKTRTCKMFAIASNKNLIRIDYTLN